MKINMKVTDLTLRGQLRKMKCGFGDDLSWVSLTDKELKSCFENTLQYYRERKKVLGKKELEYLNELENVNKIVFCKQKKEMK